MFLRRNSSPHSAFAGAGTFVLLPFPGHFEGAAVRDFKHLAYLRSFGLMTELIETLAGCIAGAVLVNGPENMVRNAGLQDIVLKSKPGYLEAMTDWEDQLYRETVERFPAGAKSCDYITRKQVQARKPAEEGVPSCEPSKSSSSAKKEKRCG